MKQQYAVIGLGRFGGRICRELMENGHEVLAIDKDENVVNEYKGVVTRALKIDTTDEEAVKGLGLQNFDHVTVAIEDNIQDSTMTTLILKEAGVKTVTTKAINDNHGKVLKRIGANRVIYSENDSGEQIPMNVVSSNVLDFVELSEQHSIVEVVVGKKMHGKTISELDVRAAYGVTILVVKTDSQLNVSPPASQMLSQDDVIVIMGEKKHVERFQDEMLDGDD